MDFYHEGILVMEGFRICPICTGPGNPLKESYLIGSDKQYLTCTICKSIFASRKATQEELLAHYSDYYSKENFEIPDVAKNSLVRTVSTFSKFRTSINAICDIGFGAGALLEAAQSFSWECSGSEYSADAIARGRSRGWKVHQGDLSSEDLCGPFDVVTIIETLEHVQDPIELLLCASVRLRSGGLLYGTTPNAGSINALILKQEWSVISYPEHPILISKKALKKLLTEAGFGDISVKSRGINPYDFISMSKRKFNSRVVSDKQDLGRVDYGYNLNSKFSRNLAGRILKNTVTFFLGKANIGDSLVFTAIKI
jgi:2-polyprenyl-3-methyl-5-hydroxy-6-metoxy-1,4-benzoquinol methylase